MEGVRSPWLNQTAWFSYLYRYQLLAMCLVRKHVFSVQQVRVDFQVYILLQTCTYV